MFSHILYPGEKRKIHSCFSNYTYSLYFCFHYFCARDSFKIALLKWEVVKIKLLSKTIGDNVEEKGAVASTIPKTICCNYNANFKLIIIKHTQWSKNCTTKQIIWLLDNTKKVILWGMYLTWRGFSGLRQRSFNATNEKVLECLPSKHENDPSIATETIEWRH